MKPKGENKGNRKENRGGRRERLKKIERVR